MITSGWILPDIYEIKCKSCSTINGHMEIVSRYLTALKSKDEGLFAKINYELEKMKNSKISIALDDFAVIKLGWIKINDSPIKIIFYTKNNPLEFLTHKYICLGYTLITLEENKPCIDIYIPSKELI